MGEHYTRVTGGGDGNDSCLIAFVANEMILKEQQESVWREMKP